MLRVGFIVRIKCKYTNETTLFLLPVLQLSTTVWELTAIPDILDSFISKTIDLVASTRSFVTLSLAFAHTCAFNLYIFIITSPWLPNKSLDIVSLEVTLLQVILLSLYHQIHWKNNLCSQLSLFHLHLIQSEFCYVTILRHESQYMKNC